MGTQDSTKGLSMNRSKSANKNRGYRNFKLAPTTREIRSALAVSAAMLALSGSGTALAGTCAVTATNEVTCNGVFTDDVTNTVPAINLVEDLTLIVGTDGATTVDPAAGVNGITSTWNGDATVISYAAINVEDAAGIFMYTNDGTGTVDNYGAIYSYGATQDAVGIYAGAYSDVTVVNDGDVAALTVTGSTYNAIGIIAESTNGYATVDNTGTVLAGSYGGSGVGVLAVGYEGATVTNDGSIGASSFTGAAVGIEAVAYYDANVYNNGSIQAYSLTGTGIGVLVVSNEGTAYAYNGGDISVGGGAALGIEAASSYGDASVSNAGSLYANGATAAFGALAIAYNDASVDNSGSVDVVSAQSAIGMAAISGYGYADVSTAAGSTTSVLGTYYALGAEASGYLGATIDNAGSIYAYAGGVVSATDGFSAIGTYAYAYEGDATIDNSGSIDAVVYAATLDPAS
jgi:hypothetical protein